MPCSISRFFIVSLLLLATFNLQAESNSNPVLVTINGHPIHKDKLERWSQSRLQGKKPQNPKQEKIMLEALIARELVVLQAIKDGIDKDLAFQQELTERTNDLLASHWTKKWLEKHAISAEELKAEYERRVANTAMPEYKARHILLESEAEAKKAISELDGGSDFSALAQRMSQDQGAKDSGDLGWFSATREMGAIVGAIQPLSKGSYTKTPVKTEHGWHVVLLEDTRKTPVPPFNKQVQDRLGLELQKKRFQKLLVQMKKEAKIELSE